MDNYITKQQLQEMRTFAKKVANKKALKLLDDTECKLKRVSKVYWDLKAVCNSVLDNKLQPTKNRRLLAGRR